MNIFVLNQTPHEAARSHCDVHVNSQIREGCQMLSTAHRMIDGEPGLVRFKRRGRWVAENRPILRKFGEIDGMLSTDARVYWDCYHNHPCTRWVRESEDNYMFLWELVSALGQQFRQRYASGVHGSITKLQTILRMPPAGLRATGLTRHPQAMPEVYRKEEPVAGYRHYYKAEKSHLYFDNTASRGRPLWFGYNKGVLPPGWLSSDICNIGKKLT